MTIDQELQLSYFQQVADIHAAHSIYLVQDIRDQKFYVKKRLTVYNADIYRYLQSFPVANTPKIIMAVEEDNVLTVIEEYIPGDTLEEILDQTGPLPEEQVIDIITQLCKILADFHRCCPAIVNRDIKPSNIKITPDGIVKLLDMNAAKWCNDRSEKDTVLLGTQGYAAPEQYGFGPSSVLTDIYAVGVLMNVMLTSELPSRCMAEGPLGKVIRKCVELSPSARYQSVAELQSALDVLSGNAPQLSEATTWRRFLPPGFRTKKVIRWLLSALGYAFLFMIGSGLKVDNAGAMEVLLNKITFTAAALCIVFFNGNYLNICQTFILASSKHRIVRWFGMVIVDIAIVSLWVIILNLLLTAFVH